MYKLCGPTSACPERGRREEIEVVEKTDQKIDQQVYKLYGLTGKEIGVVEKN